MQLEYNLQFQLCARELNLNTVGTDFLRNYCRHTCCAFIETQLEGKCFQTHLLTGEPRKRVSG